MATVYGVIIVVLLVLVCLGGCVWSKAVSCGMHVALMAAEAGQQACSAPATVFLFLVNDLLLGSCILLMLLLHQ